MASDFRVMVTITLKMTIKLALYYYLKVVKVKEERGLLAMDAVLCNAIAIIPNVSLKNEMVGIAGYVR